MTWEQHCDRGSQKDSRLARKYHNFCFFLSKITILHEEAVSRKAEENKDDAKIACDEASSEEFEESTDENNMDRY